jgi:glycosyltransferase involved in cell wall biosynthesis
VGIKLVIQIPCFNEEDSLPATLAVIPRSIAGVDVVEILVIDDGSEDRTSSVARSCGADHVVRHRRNRGLAAAFQTGIDFSLRHGADVIVNTDADNQYNANDISLLVEPILSGRADVVIGDRQVDNVEHFSSYKQFLQKAGSAVVSHLAGMKVADAVSGFRALSREAAMQINIVSQFSYTTEMLILVGKKKLAVVNVPVRTNAPVRKSRLFRSIPQFIVNSTSTILRSYALYNPFRTFLSIGLIAVIMGLVPILRFLLFYISGDGNGHIQSLVLGGTLVMIGFIALLFGVIADLIGRNRQLMEMTLFKLRQIEERLEEDS